MPGYLLDSHRPLLVVMLLVMATVSGVRAETLLLPDDIGLRSDIQLLSDAGLLSGPVTGWPLSVEALAREMQSVPVPANYQAYIRDAWYRVMTRLAQSHRFSLRLAMIDEPVEMRRFTDTPRGSGARATWRMNAGNWSLRLSLTLQDRSEDERVARMDGTYAAYRLGTWQLSAGAIPRWWGPGYEASLILSTNARPVPGISLDTVKPIRFKSAWLSWLGAMDWRIFAGKLEGDRFISDAKLLGARLSLRPTKKLEIGLSRTAQWGGEGRPENLESLVNLVLGRDNRGDAGISLADEPGNQLGGVDLRWSSPIGDAPYAVYAQAIGEDEAGGLPSRMIGMAGAEFWRGFRGGNLRVFGEIADTTIEFYKSMPRRNLAYEHGIYLDGYRYRGRALGHAMDNDGLMMALGGTWNRAMGSWEGVIRRIDVNSDGGSGNTISTMGEDRWEFWLATRQALRNGEFVVGLGAQYIDPTAAATHIDMSVFASWAQNWGATP